MDTGMQTAIITLVAFVVGYALAAVRPLIHHWIDVKIKRDFDKIRRGETP